MSDKDERAEALSELTNELADVAHRLKKQVPDMTTAQAVDVAMHLQRLAVSSDMVIVLSDIADALQGAALSRTDVH